MTARDWNLALRPKLKATRNLHELLPADLDFFVCLSSIAGIIGSRGQANYNAGNSYQDALMHHRAASGLAAAISGRAPTQIAVGTATGGQLDKSLSNDPYWFADSRFTVLSQLDRQAGGDGGGGGGSSSEAAKDDWKKLVAGATSKDQVYDLVLAQLLVGVSNIIKMNLDDIDPKKSLPALGIDSLVAIEVRTWLRKEFQADLSVFDIVSNDPLSTFVHRVTAKSALVPSGLA